MSLGQLLTSGKSLVGLHENGSRYRMCKQSLLPKFISSRNPFIGAPATTPVPTPAPARDQKENDDARAVLMPPVKGPKRLPIRWREWPLISGLVRFRERVGKSNPFPELRQHPEGSKTGAGIARQPAVQSELRLDSVRVVRNDLREADLEVVPEAGVPSPGMYRPALKSNRKSGFAGRSWGQFTTRILGAKST